MKQTGSIENPKNLNVWGKISWYEQILRKWFRFKEIGWWDHGERFTRFTLISLFGYKVFLHKLDCPNWIPHCHDHPWWFVTLILAGGYQEFTPDGKIRNRLPFSLLFRPGEFVHNVKTMGVSWSLIVTGPKSREWKFDECRNFTTTTTKTNA